jgi:hypothetical protein
LTRRLRTATLSFVVFPLPGSKTMHVLSYRSRPVKQPKPRRVLPLRDVRLYSKEDIHRVILLLALLFAACVIALTT